MRFSQKASWCRRVEFPNQCQYLLVSSNSRSAWKYLWIFLTIIALAGFSLGQTIAEDADEQQYNQEQQPALAALDTTTTNWDYRQFEYELAHFSLNPTISSLVGSTVRVEAACEATVQTKCGCRPSSSPTEQEWSSDGRYFLNATGTSGSVRQLNPDVSTPSSWWWA